MGGQQGGGGQRKEKIVIMKTSAWWNDIYRALKVKEMWRKTVRGWMSRRLVELDIYADTWWILTGSGGPGYGWIPHLIAQIWIGHGFLNIVKIILKKAGDFLAVNASLSAKLHSSAESGLKPLRPNQPRFPEDNEWGKTGGETTRVRGRAGDIKENQVR